MRPKHGLLVVLHFRRGPLMVLKSGVHAESAALGSEKPKKAGWKEPHGQPLHPYTQYRLVSVCFPLHRFTVFPACKQSYGTGPYVTKNPRVSFSTYVIT